MKKRYCFFVIFCFLIILGVDAEDPVFKPERQIVFGISPFDGVKYHSSFLPESQREMLLTANTDNTITVLLSDVYYWPITAEYRADFQGVHIPLAGKLSVYKGTELYQILETVEYIYVYPQGPTGEASLLFTGEEMVQFITEVQESMEERAANPNRRWATFQGPFRGFIVNLPEGKYRLVFSVENDKQSFSIEKELRVFSPLSFGTAYQIIPDEKWTVSSNSETPHQRIYLKPETLIYLKLFPTRLYSRSDYERMAAPHRPSSGLGLENSSLWVHEEISMEEDGQNNLVIEAAGQSGRILPQDFLVKQTEGSALGYNIFEYDPVSFPNTRPTFTAYRISAPPPGIGVTLKITDSKISDDPMDDSRRTDQSLRHLRCLEPRALELTILAFIFPLLLFVIRFGAGFFEYRKVGAVRQPSWLWRAKLR